MMTENGVSTTKEPGSEQWKAFKSHGKRYAQYDYRDIDGELFSCIDLTLSKCQLKKERWLDKKNGIVPYTVERVDNPFIGQ